VFVTIDGPNGVGKTSVCTALASRLRTQGVHVLLTGQPSRTDLGAFVRQQERDLIGMPLAVLVVADRLIQLETEIKPALRLGITVVCDRYVGSTLVLQRIDGIDPSLLWDMNDSMLIPDLSVVLAASVPTINARLDSRGRISRFDRMEDIAKLETEYFRDASDRMTSAGYLVCNLNTTDCTIEDVAETVERELLKIP
jgi:dTMP kinase